MKKIIFAVVLTSLVYGKHSVSILSTFRNESRFLKEWIEYHRLIGVEHFYLYNHLSTDNYEEVLQKYVGMGIVTLEKHINQDKPHIERMPNGFILDVVQHANANHFMSVYAENSEWVAHIDIDEFIVIPEAFDSLPVFLNTLPKKKDGLEIAAFWVYWKLFGTSNIYEIPTDEYIINHLTWRAKIQDPSKTDFKTIFKPEFSLNIHAHNPWSYARGYTYLPLPYETMNINHYTVRDEIFFFQSKLPFMKKNSEIGEKCRTEAVENPWEYLNYLNAEQDFTIQNWLRKHGDEWYLNSSF